MADDTWLDPPKGPAGLEVAFDYLKAPDFRVVWADGAVGSLTPNGLIHFALYAERHAIPRRQVFEIDATDRNRGKLGPEIVEKQISRGSIVREMACDVFLSARTAENLAHWLLDRVEELKKTKEPES